MSYNKVPNRKKLESAQIFTDRIKTCELWLKYCVIVKMHELELKNKHTQAISFKNIYKCYKTIFPKNGRNRHIQNLCNWLSLGEMQGLE